jgi:hypothetical protein
MIAVSRLLFHDYTWPILQKQHKRFLKNAYWSLFRQAIPIKQVDGTFLDQETYFASIDVLPLDQKMTIDRLLFAHRVFKYAPQQLKALIQVEQSLTTDSWISQVHEDLLWFERLQPQDNRFDTTADLGKQWRALCETTDEEWKQQIKVVKKGALIRNKILVQAKCFDRVFCSCLQEVGVCYRNDDHELQEGQSEHIFRCEECGKNFASYKAMTVHQRHKHDRCAEAKKYVFGSVCFVCEKDFHTQKRLAQHLQHSGTSCFDQIRSLMRPMTRDEMVLFAEAEKCKHKQDKTGWATLLPCVQATQAQLLDTKQKIDSFAVESVPKNEVCVFITDDESTAEK